MVKKIAMANRKTQRVPIKDNTKLGFSWAYDGDGIDLGLNRKNHRGTVKRQISHTIKANMDAGVMEIEEARRLGGLFDTEEQRQNNMRIRKLTPKECWRLMGWDDESFAKAESVNSNAQLYKQAGNGIVVNCFAAIIKELL